MGDLQVQRADESDEDVAAILGLPIGVVSRRRMKVDFRPAERAVGRHARQALMFGAGVVLGGCIVALGEHATRPVQPHSPRAGSSEVTTARVDRSKRHLLPGAPSVRTQPFQSFPLQLAQSDERLVAGHRPPAPLTDSTLVSSPHSTSRSRGYTVMRGATPRSLTRMRSPDFTRALNIAELSHKNVSTHLAASLREDAGAIRSRAAEADPGDLDRPR